MVCGESIEKKNASGSHVRGESPGLGGIANTPDATQKHTMSLDLASQLCKLLEDNQRMAEVVGLGGDVEAAKSALKGVETAEDLYQIYRTDVAPGSMSIRNLIAALDERLQDIHSNSGHCRERIRMTLESPHVASLHKMIADKKKGSTDVRLYHPSSTAKDFEAALNEFVGVMGDNVKPKIEGALKKGKGVRCAKLLQIIRPVTNNSKKTSSPAQIEAGKKLAAIIRSI